MFDGNRSFVFFLHFPKSVRSEVISKHRNDVFRLLTTVVPDEVVDVSTEIKENLKRFIEVFSIDNPQWVAIRQSLGSIA